MSNRQRDRDNAIDLRRQWEQAIADNRGHAFINAKWEAYIAVAGDQLRSIEKEAAAEKDAARA